MPLNNKAQEVQWGETGKALCKIEPGKGAETTLVHFFLTEVGAQVQESLIAQMKQLAKGQNDSENEAKEPKKE